MAILSIQEIKDKVSVIAQKYDLKAIYLFGSYARGEARENSDIDLLYVKKNSEMSLTTKYRMLADLEESLQKPVDLVSLKAFSMNSRRPGTTDMLAAIEKDQEELYVA